ncbi:MAG TPA: hypothetical protein V6C58_22755 [Allocoleopsis sp.]
MNRNHEFEKIMLGMGLALQSHITAFLLLFLIGAIAPIFIKNSLHISWYVWYYGSLTFFLWQFIYTIPLYLSLKKKGKFTEIKGVIIMTVCAILINGSCARILEITPKHR